MPIDAQLIWSSIIVTAMLFALSRAADNKRLDLAVYILIITFLLSFIVGG